MTEYFLDVTYNSNAQKDYKNGKDMKWQERDNDERSKPLKVVALKILGKDGITGVRIDKRSGKVGQEEMTTSWVRFEK